MILALAFSPLPALAYDDTQPPETHIAETPAVITAVFTASFSLQGTDDLTPAAALTYECRLDGSIWATCPAAPTYSDLQDGQHSFAARAVDAAGNLDPTPAEYTWTIDTTPPDTYIAIPTIFPNGPMASASIGLLGIDAISEAVQFRCRLDQATWEPCTNPAVYTRLDAGSYRFEVYAVDQAGNHDPSPAGMTLNVPWRAFIPLVENVSE